MNKETSFSIENLKNRILSNESIIGAVKNICQMIKKRSAIILTLFLLIINPALFGQLVDIICGVFNKTSYLFPVAVIETVVSIVILIKVSKRLSTRRDVLYFCVLLEFIFRIGFNVDFIKTSTYTLVLSVIILILFMRKELILFIPFISLAANLSDFQFVNEFLISIIVIYFLANYKELSCFANINKNEKLTIVFTIAVYIITATIDLNSFSDELKKSAMTWQYYNDYFKFGFGARGLIATIREIIMQGNGSLKATQLYILGIHMIPIICMIFSAIICVKRKIIKKDSELLIIIAMFCSLGFRNLALKELYIIFDAVLIAVAIICLLLAIRGKRIWLICPLTFIGMCMHHGFAFFLFPAIFAILIYKYLSEEDKKERNKTIIVAVFTTIIVVMLFAYFHFFAYKTNSVSFEETCAYMAECAERELPDYPLHENFERLKKENGYLYINIDYIMYNGKVDNYGSHTINWDGLFNSFVLWVFMIPIICLIFKHYSYLNNSRKIDKALAVLAPATIFIILISYLEIDYGRWNQFLILVSLFELLSFSMIGKEKSYINSLDEIRKNRLCRILVLFMMMVPNMGVFGA